MIMLVSGDSVSSHLPLAAFHYFCYSGGRDKVMLVWDLDTKQRVQTIPVFEVGNPPSYIWTWFACPLMRDAM